MRPSGSNINDDTGTTYLHVTLIKSHIKKGDAQERIFSFEERDGEELYSSVQSQIIDTLHIFFLTQSIDFSVQIILKFVIWIPSIGEQLGRTLTFNWTYDDLIEMGYPMDGTGELDDLLNSYKRAFFAKSFNEQLNKRVKQIIHLNEVTKTARLLHPEDPDPSYIDFTDDDVELFFSAPMPWSLINFKFLNVTFS